MISESSSASLLSLTSIANSKYKDSLCPLGGHVMTDPVYVNGVDYDRVNLVGYVNANNGKCPKGRKANLDDMLTSSKII